MRAAILAVGSELLGTERLDTNSLRLAVVLERYGVELARKAVVGDDRESIAAEVGRMAAEHAVVLITGGLGPTTDDLTREAVADAFGLRLQLDPAVAEEIADKFRRHGIEMPEVNRRQAQVPSGAEVIPNPRGTAPGLRLEHGDATLFLFPGVPRELAGMIGSHLEPWLASRSSGASLETGVLKVACLPESVVEERIAPAYDELGREAISVLARPGQIELHFRATGHQAERRERLRRTAVRLRELVGDAVFTDDPEASLASVVGDLLRRRGETLVTAESCTGGLVAEWLTGVAGSSDYFAGGVVSYSNRLKTALLGVPETLLAEHGAVSEPVARAMARGARERLGGDWAVALTGVAGPGGGSVDKPVGTVHLAVAGPPPAAGGESEVEHRLVRFPGDRERVRRMSALFVLDRLRRRLLAREGAAS